VSRTNNFVGPVFFLAVLGFFDTTGGGARWRGSGLADACSKCCIGLRFNEGSSADFFVEDFLAPAISLCWGTGACDVFSNLAMCLVASSEARCVGAGGSGINQGLGGNVESVDAKKKPP